MTTRRALIIVDVQNDFCPGGSLATPGGAETAAEIAEWVLDHRDRYDAVATTQDWHIDPGDHFAGDAEPDFQETWPHHCVVGTGGADFHPGLEPALDEVDAMFRKGMHDAAYSGFEGVLVDDNETDPSRGDTTGLAAWLRHRDIEAVDVVGIATDFCVAATARDAAANGFDTSVLIDLCASVQPDITETVTDLTARGVHVVSAAALQG